MASLNIATAISFEGFSNERHHRPQLQQHLQQHVCQQAASRTLAVLLAKHQGPLHSPPPPSPPSATPLFAYDHHHLSNENQPTVRTSGSGLQGNPWGRATGRQSLEKLKRVFFYKFGPRPLRQPPCYSSLNGLPIFRLSGGYSFHKCSSSVGHNTEEDPMWLTGC